MQKQYLLGTDIGTSSTKTVLADIHGYIIASAPENYEVIFPQNAWAEQWPDAWKNAVVSTVRRTMQQSKVNPEEVASLCISGLYGGIGVPLDENMEVVRPCIIWMDRRAESLCTKLEKQLDTQELFRITENGIDSYFGYGKMLWIRDNEPENWARIRIFLTPYQYVAYQFTGEIAIDRTSAGNLGGLFDIEKNDWSDVMLEQLGIRRSLLPQKIVDPTDIIGKLSKEAAASLKLTPGLPVCAGCVDCLASTLSSGVYTSNQVVAVLATSLNLGVLHCDKPTDPRYISMPYLTNCHDLRYSYGGISTAGALTKWFVSNLGLADKTEFSDMKERQRIFSEYEKTAADIPAGSEGLIVLPYFSGERTPIWDSNARGCIMGLTLKHTNAHIYRAVLESIGFALRHVMENYGVDFQEMPSCSIVGGGTSSSLWVQILADITGVKMECMTDGVEAPIGDAFMAGYASGIFTDFEEISRWTKSHMVFCPNWQNHELYNRYYDVYKRLYISAKDEMHALAELGLSF